MKQFPSIGACLVAAASWLVAGCSTPSTPHSVGSAPPAAIEIESDTNTASVVAIDAPTRTITLRYADGTVNGFFCRPEVRNFEQIKVGDKVTFANARTTSLFLARNGALPGPAAPLDVTRAAPGEKPGGRIVETIVFTGEVRSVDRQSHRITVISDGAGVLKTMTADPKVDLARIRPKERMAIRTRLVTEIAVETP